MLLRLSFALADQRTMNQAFEADAATYQRSDVGQDLRHAEEAVRSLAAEADRHQNRFDFHHAAIFAGTDRMQAQRRRLGQGLTHQLVEAYAAVRIPRRKEIAAPQLSAVAGAERRSGEPISERPLTPVEQEDEGQQALQRLGVDVGLVRAGAAVTDEAPIADRKMTVSVFHNRSPALPPLFQLDPDAVFERVP